MKKMLASILGGMVGGAIMALAIYATRQVGLTETSSGAVEKATEDKSMLARYVIISAALGGLYGAIRSALHVPGFLAGPLFGLASMGLNRMGLGPEVSETPGPWNGNTMELVPELVTRTIYGTVTDFVSERIESALS